MNLLKNLLNVYLFILGAIALLFLILLPIILSEYLENQNYLWGFFINLPIFFAGVFSYVDMGHHARPTRPMRKRR